MDMTKSEPKVDAAPSSQTGSNHLSINDIASQLANSKAAQQAVAISLLNSASAAAAAAQQSNGTATTTTTTSSSNPIVTKMTEALSLKQSPTLTKQLTQPLGGTANKVQVITHYMCRYCGQQFDSPTVMQQHIQNHIQGKTPHQCSVCGKEYRTPSKLQRHVRVHSGERPYACSVCGRRFTRSDHVKQHMKVHFQAAAKGKPVLKFQVKDLNICRMCNDMKFNRRQALHLHLQQQHLIQQVFTCHRCGEAYESLEEMQSHKLTHDSVLNSMKDGSISGASANGVAKFALGPQKSDQVMNKFDIIKPETNLIPIKPLINDTVKLKEKEKIVEESLESKLEKNGFFIPANMDNVSALSNQLILEGMEKMAKEAAELEVQKKYHEELMKLGDEARKYEESKEGDKDELEERIKISECFTIKPEKMDDKEIGGNEEEDDDDSKQATTLVSEDGMSMFILPKTVEEMNAEEEENMIKGYTEMEEDENEFANLSKGLSAPLMAENADQLDVEGMEEMEHSGEHDKTNSEDTPRLQAAVSLLDGKIKTGIGRTDGYSKPCPKSKKPWYVAPGGYLGESKLVIDQGPDPAQDSSGGKGSILNSKLNELIKAKMENNQSHPGTVILTNTNTSLLPNAQTAKLTFLPTVSPALSATGGIVQSFLLPITGNSKPIALSSAPVTTVSAAAAGVSTQVRIAPKPKKAEAPKLLRCEHCCIWFEDNAMCLLHNTLHSADEADPFTCRKCYKKLGNRLEFMAHLVWHLEPNMDI